MADIDAKAKELAGRLEAQVPIGTPIKVCRLMDEAAALILSQAETIAELRKALNLIDALDPEQRVYGCSSDALRGLVIQMGQYARTALARAAKEGQDA